MYSGIKFPGVLSVEKGNWCHLSKADKTMTKLKGYKDWVGNIVFSNGKKKNKNCSLCVSRYQMLS